MYNDFKIEAQNSHGYSQYSDVLTLLCAYIPLPPVTVTTSNTIDNVNVIWSGPTTNGSPITSYKIFILQNDQLTYTQESVDCNGSDAAVVSNRECNIQLTTLLASPYSLVLNDPDSIKITPINIYGESEMSTASSGTFI